MKLREVRTGLLVKKAITYRIFVLFTQMIFMWLLTKNAAFAVTASILWNIINTVEYFGFDYVFARIYRVGKNDK